MAAGPPQPVPADPLGPAAAVSRETRAALGRYEALLRDRQKAVNLVGPATLEAVWERHFRDSAQLLPLITARADGRPPVVLDIGAGAGFPGLVLAVLAATGAGPALEVHLVEANARKCAFLREAARLTGARATVHRARIEDMEPFPVDVLTARAVAPLARLLESAAGFLALPGARPVGLFLKGRGAHRELTEARNGWKMRAEVFVSVTDPGGVVLRLEDIARG